jgi:hypothetical protein
VREAIEVESDMVPVEDVVIVVVFWRVFAGFVDRRKGNRDRRVRSSHGILLLRHLDRMLCKGLMKMVDINAMIPTFEEFIYPPFP